ncbi:MAG: hypothetical protein QNL59_04545 [Actinomycetota bacterium]
MNSTATDAAFTNALRSRAESLRFRSSSLNPVLASTYQRRACELELELWVHEVRSGITPVDPPLAA